MDMRHQGALVFVVVAALALAAHDAAAENIQKRKQNQQRRINNGINTGKLSPQEATRLQEKENAINREEQEMKEVHGGHLTQSDRRAIQRQQDEVSRKIHRQKHDQNDK